MNNQFLIKMVSRVNRIKYFGCIYQQIKTLAEKHFVPFQKLNILLEINFSSFVTSEELFVVSPMT